jgi:hypothetical protein
MLCSIVLCTVLLFPVSAWAIPPFSEVFKKTYVKAGGPAGPVVAELKCSVCHDAKVKAMRNDFGKAVGKYLKKADFVGDKKTFPNVRDAPAQEAIRKGLQAAMAEKYKDGPSYGELIDMGEFPFAAPGKDEK